LQVIWSLTPLGCAPWIRPPRDSSIAAQAWFKSKTRSGAKRFLAQNPFGPEMGNVAVSATAKGAG
jgi:hypothetical protein